MWIFTTRGFISVVADCDNPGILLVRARLPGHIEDLVPNALVSETPDCDYRYRARVSRIGFMDRISDEIYDIDYDNFKEAAGEAQHPYLMKIWRIMVDAQEREAKRAYHGKRAVVPTRRRKK